MQHSNENLRFYVYMEAKRGVTAKETLEHLREALSDAAPSQSFVCKWHKDFTSGERQSVETRERPGRPVLQRTQANISGVFDFVESYPKSSVACIASSLNLSWETVRRILVDDLLFRKVCSMWIPHALTAENRQQRVQCCQSILQLFRDNLEFELLRVWVTQDETWVPFEMLPPKEDNKVWIAPQTSRPTVVREQLTFKKTMLSIAFTGNGKVSADVTERGETVDSERYVEFVHRTGELWRKLRSDPTNLKELLWQHDNARPHTAAATVRFFQRRRIQLVKQSPYSPDLNQCDRWIFKELKKGLRQRSLQCAQDVLHATQELFRKIPPERFQFELESLRQHCEKVIQCDGDYVSHV
jgi:hypothetical protein